MTFKQSCRGVAQLTEQEKLEWEEYEKKGYDAWIELWVADGAFPRPSMCPARYMKDESIQRRAFLRGWVRASAQARTEQE